MSNESFWPLGPLFGSGVVVSKNLIPIGLQTNSDFPFQYLWYVTDRLLSVFVFCISGEKGDQYSWTTFTAPFSWKLWIGIFVLSSFASIVIWILHRFPNKSTKMNILESFTISTAPIFGIALYDANNQDTSASARLTLFVVFLCSSLYFYTYGGFLTSSLAIPIENLPFHTPEDILKTSYR